MSLWKLKTLYRLFSTQKNLPISARQKNDIRNFDILEIDTYCEMKALNQTQLAHNLAIQTALASAHNDNRSNANRHVG